MADAGKRAELIALVDQIKRAEGTEEELNRLVESFERQVPHPGACDLIYWPSRRGLGSDPTSAEIVDAALAYRPIQL